MGQSIGITYRGAGVPANAKYLGISGDNGAHLAELRQNSREYGWSNEAAQCIGFGIKFFVPEETLFRRTVIHDHESLKMGSTRGGAVLHELSHFYANTADEILPPRPSSLSICLMPVEE